VDYRLTGAYLSYLNARELRVRWPIDMSTALDPSTDSRKSDRDGAYVSVGGRSRAFESADVERPEVGQER